MKTNINVPIWLCGIENVCYGAKQKLEWLKHECDNPLHLRLVGFDPFVTAFCVNIKRSLRTKLHAGEGFSINSRVTLYFIFQMLTYLPGYPKWN